MRSPQSFSVLSSLCGTFHCTSMPQTTQFFRNQIMFPLALRILTVWIFNNTGKSIFATIPFHAMFNTGYMVSEANHGVVTAVSLIFALVVVYLWTPKTMAHYRANSAKP